MENKGWIKIFRSITDDEDYFAERFTREMAWIDLLLLANFKDSTIIKRGVKIQLHRGQIFKSIRFLSDRWQWNARTTMKFLDSLELEGKIQRKITNVNTLITITNYSNYQDECNTECNTECNAECNTECNTECNAYNKNVKNIKKVKKEREEIHTYVCKEKKPSADSENFSVEKDSGNSAQLIPEEKEKEKKVAPKRESRFTPPTLEEVKDYEAQKGYTFSAEKFWGYYESNGWRVGKNPMKSWHGACVTWQGKQNEESNNLNLNQNATIQPTGGRASANEPEWLRHQRENEEYLQYHLKRAMSKLETRDDDAKNIDGIF